MIVLQISEQQDVVNNFIVVEKLLDIRELFISDTHVHIE